jgi:demethylmenaquinone methyltransferase/2-methoxy-6-polyprenyl-1,4-benzoquinol methylase
VTNKFLITGERRAEGVEKLFTTIARRYDLINDIMSAGAHRAWKRELARMSGFAEGQRALDLCCGTGDIAFLLAAKAMRTTVAQASSLRRNEADDDSQAGSSRYSVAGLDFTEPMLRLASERARVLREAGHDAGVTFVRGDALRLPFPDESFDVVTVGYGLRNLADLRRGLSEARRVLKPRGIFLSVDMGKPPNVVWRRIVFAHLRLTLPTLGWLFFREPDTYKYLLDSLEIYPAQVGVKQLMEQVGFVETGYRNFWGGIAAINYGRK